MNTLQKRKALTVAASTIAHFEGGMSRDGKFHAYWDPNGRVWTQGFGHTENVKPHARPWSLAKAKRVLRADLKKRYGKAVLARPMPGPYYAAAIISAIYNLGVGMLDRSHTLGDELAKHHWKKAVDSLDLYVSSGGQRLQGLVNRRNAEQALARRDL